MPDLAVVHGLDGVLIELVGARLEIHQEAELLRGGLLAALGDGQAAGHIHGDRLGQIDMLARLDAGRGLLGMEVRRASRSPPHRASAPAACGSRKGR